MTRLKHAAAVSLTALAMTAAASLARADTVVLASYSGIFQDNYVKAVVEPFMKANPEVKVEFYGIKSSAMMLGTLRAQASAPQIDAVIMDVSVAKAATDEGLFAPMDATVTKHLPDLYPQAKIKGVNAVGVTFDNLVLLYNTDKVKQRPTSWNTLWDPQYAKQVSVSAVPDIQGTTLTIITNKMAGGANYIESVEAGIKRLEELAPKVQTWEPSPDSFQPVISGTTSIGIGWNARGQVYSDLSGGKLGVVLPVEGSGFQINAIALVKGGTAGESAKKFIDYALSPEAQAGFTKQMFYAPTNAKAVPLIPEAVLARTAAGSMDKMIDIDWLEVAKIRDSITEQWRRRVIPLSR